ncbi:MAG: ATP-dependent RNA helicase DbpA [Candidatus Omnitrophica bacterium ADurb.Bin277]|nr:MAG: ATP-dependent RNA helicase DbpA [Candidatus Omnitrophica bacterium ADurb.Bin277]
MISPVLSASTPLFKHQDEAVRFVINRGGNAAIFHDCGLGKTRTAIEIFRRLRVQNPRLKMMVIAPLSLLNAAWACDIAKFSEFTVQDLHDNFCISEKPDVYLVNYETLIADKKTKILESFIRNYEIFCVVDESSRLKNPKAKTTKTLLGLCDKFKYRVIMSGTPAPNGEHEYWAQMEFVRPGLLHPSFYAFRNTFFHLERNGKKLIQQGQFMTRQMARDIFSKGWKYAITPANRVQLMKRIAPVCHFAKKDECLDLPDQVDEIREVQLTAKQRVIYNEMKRELITEISGEVITAQAALTKLIKLREITSGFLMNAESEQIEIDGGNPKINELVNFVEEAGDQPTIVFANFHYEMRKIRDALAPMGRVVTLYSETEDKNQSIRDFQEGRARFLVCNAHSASHGLTFVNSSLQIFFSLDFSWETYHQAKARIHRAGQKKSCLYVHLIAKDTIDEEVFRVLQKKQSVQDAIYQFLKVKHA